MNDKKEVIETVLPSLAAYEALMIIKRILDVKELEKKKELEKLERDGGNTMRLAKAVTSEGNGVSSEDGADNDDPGREV